MCICKMFIILLAAALVVIVTGQCTHNSNEHIWTIEQRLDGIENKIDQRIDKLEGLLQKCQVQSTQDTVKVDDNKPHNCQDILDQGYYQSGEYTIYIPGLPAPKPVQVYCDQQRDGGGWLVIQRREDGSVDFFRDWDAYTQGFGDVTGEFWLGNTFIHQLSRSAEMELRIDMMSENSTWIYAKYRHFSIGSEKEKFVLSSVSGYSGDAGDRFSGQQGSMFSTHDEDNDTHRNGNNCAAIHKGGWWYASCFTCYLNGPYVSREQRPAQLNAAIHWGDYRSPWAFLRFSEMKIRPAQ